MREILAEQENVFTRLFASLGDDIVVMNAVTLQFTLVNAPEWSGDISEVMTSKEG